MLKLQNETIGMRVPEITKCTHLSRPAVSHHLQVLKDAGLIGMHRAGTMNYYYADADSGCWSGLKALVDHMEQTATSPVADQTVFISHGDCIEDAKYVENILKTKYGVKEVLINYTDARYTKALRWLRWLGFHMHEAVPYGVNGELFHPMTLRGF